MKFKAIIFDYDGLMVDTEKIWKAYYYKANKKFKTNFTEQDRANTIGKNEIEIRKALRETNANISIDEYRDWMKQKVHHHVLTKGVKVKKGLKDLLKYSHQNNLLTAIASGSSQDIICKVLSKVNIDLTKFKVMATGEKNIKPKPSPDIYLYVCKSLGLKPEECVVLEDSYLGVHAGHSAGCFTIMIPDTLPVTDEMKKTADLILPNMLEVIKFLEQV